MAVKKKVGYAKNRISHLKKITAVAKKLYASGKYAKWTDAISAASKLQKPAAKKAPAKKKAATVKKKRPIKKAVAKKSVARKAATKKKAATKRVSGSTSKVITGMLKKFTAVFFPVGFPVVSASVEAENTVMAKRLAKKWAVTKGIKLKPSGIKIWPFGQKQKFIS